MKICDLNEGSMVRHNFLVYMVVKKISKNGKIEISWFNLNHGKFYHAFDYLPNDNFFETFLVAK